MFRYVLAFGSNLGNRQENCDRSLLLLQSFFKVLRVSARTLTAPLKSDQYDTSNHEAYLNFVCEGESLLDPGQLYAQIVELENRIGHNRQHKWHPREIDIDVLFAANSSNALFEKCMPVQWRSGQASFPDLQVPHAQFWQRDFLVAMVTVELGISAKALRDHFLPSAQLKG